MKCSLHVSNEFGFNLHNTKVDNNLNSSTFDTVRRPSSRPAVSSRDAVMGGFSSNLLVPSLPSFLPSGVIRIDCFVQLDTEVIQWDYHMISCLLRL